MGDYGIAVTWGEFKPGREKKALALWADSVAMNDKAVADGRLESWDAIIFEPTGPGTPAGAVRLIGTQQQIEAFVQADDFREVILRGQHLLAGFAYRRFLTGHALMEAVAQTSAVIDEL